MIDAAAGDGFSLLLVDLDRFKEVNDVLGHQSGDDLLLPGRRSGSPTRCATEDLLARLGGDEFAVLVGGASGAEAGLEIARRLSGALCQRVRPQRRARCTSRRRSASRATRSTAPTRRRCCAAPTPRCTRPRSCSTELELFDGKRDHHSPTRLKRLGELRQALDRGELVLHYQPKLQLENGHDPRRRGARALAAPRARACSRPASSSRSPSRPG